jgi:hypothetical protein
MDLPPRSFAADAHDCIMAPILADRPNTRLWRDSAPDDELPSDQVEPDLQAARRRMSMKGEPTK